MLKKLIKILRKDEGTREAWRANIACAIMDTKQAKDESDYKWHNRCAETFLNRLCSQPEIDEDVPGMMGLALSVGK